MIKQENPNFVASFYAPNPMEVTYWIDLSTDANGNVIKSYAGNDWLPVNYFTNTDQSVEIKKLKQEIADEVNRAKQAEQKLTNDLNGKVTSTDVTQIKIVDEIPEVGSQTPGILYIKLLA